MSAASVKASKYSAPAAGCAADVLLALARQGAGLTAITHNTITSLDDLITELGQVRAAGHAEEHGEAVAGRCCIAVTAPLRQVPTRAVGISVSMNEARFAQARDAVLNGLQEARDQIVREVRGRAAVGEQASSTDLMIGGISSW